MTILATELNTKDIPQIYSRFAELIGDQHWKRRTINIKSAIRGNRFLEELYLKENALALSLEDCRELSIKYGAIPNIPEIQRTLYSPLAFAAQVISIIESSPPDEAKKFIRRIHGAFSNPVEFFALGLELTAATHFIHAGFEIEWPEMTKGKGTFDIYIPSMGSDGVEVECKAFTSDKGRKIHERDSLTFYHHLQKLKVKPLPNVGLSVTIRVPDRFPTSHSEVVELAKAVAQSAQEMTSQTTSNNIVIETKEFSLKSLEKAFERHGLKDRNVAIEETLGKKNIHAMIIMPPSLTSATIFILESAKESSLIRSAFDTLSDAAKQVSGKKAAMLFGGFQGINSADIVNLFAHDNDPNNPPTALRVGASEFLSDPRRTHIVNTIFLCKEDMSRRPDGIISSDSTAYIFPNNKSKFWEDSFKWSNFSQKNLRLD